VMFFCFGLNVHLYVVDVCLNKNEWMNVLILLD